MPLTQMLFKGQMFNGIILIPETVLRVCLCRASGARVSGVADRQTEKNLLFIIKMSAVLVIAIHK